MPMTDTPRIYVACLASYNAGRLHGEWIDAAQDVESLNDAVQAMLKASPMPGAEEFAIHDHEGFRGLEVGEYDGLVRVSRLAELLKEHGSAFAVFYNNDSYGELDEIAERFEEEFNGEWNSEEEFAEQLADDIGIFQDASDTLKSYFDYERFARDLFIGDYWSGTDDAGTLYVFRRD